MKFIERNCPLCNGNQSKVLFEIPTSSFVLNNETIIPSKLRQLGLYEDSSGMELVECDCNMIYVSSVLPYEILNRYYNECIDADLSLKKTHRILKQNHYDNLSKLLINRDLNVTVFEYGCGWGDFLVKARRDAARVIGLELDRRKIDFCKSQGLQIINRLSEIDSHIDVFFCNHVLEHLPDPKKTLLEIKQYLHPKFIGYISVPLYTRKKIMDIKNKINSNIQVLDKNINPYEHLNVFSIETLHNLLNSVGFYGSYNTHGVVFRNCILM